MKKTTTLISAHPWHILCGWLALLLVLAGGALQLGSAFNEDVALPDSESSQAYALLGSAGSGQSATTSGKIVWHVADGSITDPLVVSEAQTMLDAVASLDGVESVTSPYDSEAVGAVNPSTNTAFATVSLKEGTSTEPVRSAVAAHSGSLETALGGTAFDEQPTPSHGTEAVGILAALLILFLVFRSVWAALLPILTGVVGVGAGLLTTILISHAVHIPSASITMASLVGLGVGIDYALFVVNRFRKALMVGRSTPEALAESLNTSGRAVLFAGLTVIIALAGMTVVGLNLLTAMAGVADLTVLFTVLTALTLLPALSVVIGRRVLPKKLREGVTVPNQPGFSARWARVLQRRPLATGVLGLVMLLVVASPALSMRVGNADASSDPVGSDTRTYYDLMTPAFGAGIDSPILLVAQTPTSQADTAFNDLVTQISGADDVAAANVLPATGEGVTTAVVIPGSSSQTVETEDLVNNLRENVIPSATAGSDLRVYVGGEASSNIDLSQALMNKLPLYLGLIAVLGFLLLTIAFRSVVIPLIGALSNLLTIAVGLGCITAIFQFGWGSQVLGVGSGAPIMYIVPVILMGVVFGLSMDYQVFLVSRMHEEWTMHKNNQRAVRVGVSETAPVIITAASIMLCVFASFAFTSERIIASMGIGLALSVLTDALIVRLVVIPSFMNMLGNANWWFPGKRSNRHPATVHPTPLESGADAAEDLVPAAV